jgi:hypothetical protein
MIYPQITQITRIKDKNDYLYVFNLCNLRNLWIKKP